MQPPKTIAEILNQTHRDYFYLMHLSWRERSSREEIWNFAKAHRLIGLSRPRHIDRRWDEVSNSQRMSLSHTWRRQFEQFASMRYGDCVLVANGHTDILGIGLAREPYEYKKELDQDFFGHVRNMQWLIAYDWGHRRPARIDGFDHTLRRIDEKS